MQAMQMSVLIAQLRPEKARYDKNVARLREVFAQVQTLSPRPDVLVLPETFLSGYFVQGGVREVARSAGEVAADLQAAFVAACGVSAPALDVVVGFYERYQAAYYNSSLYVTLGVSPDGEPVAAPGVAPSGYCIRHVHRKVFLPTYGVFDDARFVAEGHQVAAFATRWGRAAMLICEDAWHNISGLLAALDGAQVVFVVSSSPARGAGGERPANVEHWEDLARRIADEHGVFVVLAQLVGFEGGKGFPGGSLVMSPRGEVLVQGPLWDEAMIMATIDCADLPLARADTPLLDDLQTMLPHLQRELARVAQRRPAVVAWDDVCSPSTKTELKPTTQSTVPTIAPTTLPVWRAEGFDPSSDAILQINTRLVHDWLIAFLRDEVVRRRGFSDVVLALSGGVDSALTAFLCAEAFGPEHVLALRMPYRTSSQESLEHAQLCVDALGIRVKTVDISAAVDGYAGLDGEMDSHRKGNVMARMRMIVLFDHSQKLGALPIGTGNKTERLFGYFTWHADDSPPVNPLGDLFKTQVWELARFVGVPAVIVEKPASADLIVGQTDEADMGISYPRADRILHFLLQGYDTAKLEQMGFPVEDVRLVKRRLDGTHWKRNLPSTAVLSTTAIGEFYLRPLDF